MPAERDSFFRDVRDLIESEYIDSLKAPTPIFPFIAIPENFPEASEQIADTISRLMEIPVTEGDRGILANLYGSINDLAETNAVLTLCRTDGTIEPLIFMAKPESYEQRQNALNEISVSTTWGLKESKSDLKIKIGITSSRGLTGATLLRSAHMFSNSMGPLSGAIWTPIR